MTKLNKTDKNTRIEYLIEKLFNMKGGFSKGMRTTHDDGQWIEINSGGGIKRNYVPDHPWLYNYGLGLDNDKNETLFDAAGGCHINEPAKTIGDDFEVVMFKDFSISWFKYVKFNPSKLRGISPISKCTLYEKHQRTIQLNGEVDYEKCMVGVNGFKQTPIMVQGKLHDTNDNIVLSASFKEEFYKVGVFHMKITNDANGQGIRLACEPWEVIELMKYRNNPITLNGNKKPVLHWVSKYIKGELRKTKVDAHIRGLGNFNIDGFTIEITKPEKYIHEL